MSENKLVRIPGGKKNKCLILNPGLKNNSLSSTRKKIRSGIRNNISTQALSWKMESVWNSC